MKKGFHCVELNKTKWEIPERYVNLQGIGSGAYGQVIYTYTVFPLLYLIICM